MAKFEKTEKNQRKRLLKAQAKTMQALRAGQDSTVYRTTLAVDTTRTIERKPIMENKVQAGLVKEGTRTQAIKQGALAQCGTVMRVTRHKPQGKAVNRKQYAPSVPNMQALPIVDGIKVLPRIKRAPNLAKCDSDYQKPRFQNVKKRKNAFKRWGEE